MATPGSWTGPQATAGLTQTEHYADWRSPTRDGSPIRPCQPPWEPLGWVAGMIVVSENHQPVRAPTEEKG